MRLGVVFMLMSTILFADIASDRKACQQLQKEGNYKEAYDGYVKLLRDKANTGYDAAKDFQEAVGCLKKLNRISEYDALRDEVLEIRPRDWRFVSYSAMRVQADAYGYVIDGQFRRGQNRGRGGRYVTVEAQERLYWLRAMLARPVLDLLSKDRSDRGYYYSAMQHLVLGSSRSRDSAWELQILTDLNQAPDYTESSELQNRRMLRGVPVDSDGKPVFFALPARWEDAKNDGERYRWCLQKMSEYDRKPEALMILALQALEWYETRKYDCTDEGVLNLLKNLTDKEGYTTLATGRMRFTFPDDYNPIKLYERLREYPDYYRYSEQHLAQIYENRFQFDKAVEHWQNIVKSQNSESARKRIAEITGKNITFLPGKPQVAGKNAEVSVVFRNATQATFTAREIDLDVLVADTWKYIESKPTSRDWRKMSFSEVGARLFDTPEGKKYLGKIVATWETTLTPAPGYLDKAATLTTPLKKAGAYLVECSLKDGNKARIVVLLREYEIVKKSLMKGGDMWQVLDALTGKPQPFVKVQILAYSEYWDNAKKKNFLFVKKVLKTADKDGCVYVKGSELLKKKADDYSVNLQVKALSPDGKKVFYGTTSGWFTPDRDAAYVPGYYNTDKRYVMTDRPVYRPKQQVHSKIWMTNIGYGKLGDKNYYAGADIVIRVVDGKSNEVFKTKKVLDEYGGVEFDFMLAEDAVLGEYVVQYQEGSWWARIGSFRVEEYKKPEYSVTVETPGEAIALGDKLPVKVIAKYYFGAPVADAEISLKVTRSRRAAGWYPCGIWDWFYGKGYWWHFEDYAWYPGWRRWCLANDWLFGRSAWSREAPEVVIQQNGVLDADGTYTVMLDTALAKELYGDSDQLYSVTAEVRDKSRRTIVGKGAVTAALKPFRTYVWMKHGYLHVGEAAMVCMDARTADGASVTGKGRLTLYKVRYDGAGEAYETAVQTWDTGDAREQSISCSAPGQYRLGYALTDAKGQTEESGIVFSVSGQGDDGRNYRYNGLELIPDKAEYAPGDVMNLLVNTEQANSTVMLFVRAFNSFVPQPQVLRITGKSTIVKIPITADDMPNMFVEAYTMADGKLHNVRREIVVPPEKKILNIDVIPAKTSVLPGVKGTVQLHVTDVSGKPVKGSLVVTVYDKSLEYIAPRTTPNIREFFWKWQYHHEILSVLLSQWQLSAIWKNGETAMNYLSYQNWGVQKYGMDRNQRNNGMKVYKSKSGAGKSAMMDMAVESRAATVDGAVAEAAETESGAEMPADSVEVRSNFADTALWIGRLNTDEQGNAALEIPMPENLTTWKIQVWGMGDKISVGEGTAEIITTKNLIVRLQAPRFFVEKDEVILSANIHNYLAEAKNVTAVLELPGGCLTPLDAVTRVVQVPSNGEARIDWRVKAVKAGEAVVRMKAVTDAESDGMEQRFPVLVHGADKMVAVSAAMRPEQNSCTVSFEVPEQRRLESTKLELHWSPSLAMAMVDALPYLIEYPYGCTEQTLNRFLPAVRTQQILLKLGISLQDIAAGTANMNSQEHGAATARKAQWQRYERAAVFSEEELSKVVKKGVKDLLQMQCSDGGWGWFSGYGEQSWAHTTAVVAQGLIIASKRCNVALDDEALIRGLRWLQAYQQGELQKLKNAEKKIELWKDTASELDAFVHRVLAEAYSLKLVSETPSQKQMEDFLYRDKTKLSPYGLSLFGLGLYYSGNNERCAEVVRNLRQYVVEDTENQTAWLNLGGGCWWCWYGDEIETHAAFLKLLAEYEPKGDLAPKLVKYLLNNRKHSTYWNSTRDTANCLDAFATYALNSGEVAPDMTVEVKLDGKVVATSRITKANMFQADLGLVLTGADVASGKHELTIAKTGRGPLYVTSAVSYFSMEDYITAAGLEVKVNRTVTRLVRDDVNVDTAGSRGQATKMRAEHYRREVLKDGDVVKSGDLLEIELVIESKNDYEYLLLEDMKAAGTEPVDLRSGYNGNSLGAYVEFRDSKVAFFLRTLPRGRRSVTYRLRAETPGVFSALPTQIYAMYAPELHGNSNEFKLKIQD